VFTKIKRRMPWWGKIIAKLVLSRSPLSYSVWQELDLFRHGYMDSPIYALGVFEAHVVRAGLGGHLQGMTIVEMGPGDSIATAIIAKCHGARAILLDVGHFAKEDLRPYLALCELPRKRGLEPPDLSRASTLQDVLSACNAEYLTGGLVSWQQITSNTVDFVFSQAVLEHIPKEEFLPTMQECRRVMRAGSIVSHTVDLRDHLGDALNSLRFSEDIWESNLFKSSGFYTNRIRYTNMLKMFDAAGFVVDKTEVLRWDRLPTSRKKLAPPFRLMPEDELCISGFNICLRVSGSLRR
jgi:SAM-dependent methyltransferase